MKANLLLVLNTRAFGICMHSVRVSSAGHSEKAFNTFAVTPDNEHVVFLGKDGYMIFLSGRVRGESVGCEGESCEG